jgi:hypothetical protein
MPWITLFGEGEEKKEGLIPLLDSLICSWLPREKIGRGLGRGRSPLSLKIPSPARKNSGC